MKTSVNALLEALTHPSFYLLGDEDAGVSLHCRDHHDGGRPLAYYGRDAYPDPAVPTAATIPGLWACAVDHLAQIHGEIGRDPGVAFRHQDHGRN